MRTHWCKTVLAGVVLTLTLAAPLQAQNTPAKVHQYGRGTTKMKAGAILMAAGVFFIVTTPGAEKFVVPATFGTGMGLILWGAKDRSDAVKRSTAFGADLGRTSKRLYFSRRW